MVIFYYKKIDLPIRTFFDFFFNLEIIIFLHQKQYYRNTILRNYLVYVFICFSISSLRDRSIVWFFLQSRENSQE